MGDNVEEISRTQIDRLGERLRDSESVTDHDRILLDRVRRSLTSFSRQVTEDIARVTGYPITERPGKTTLSIVAKLKHQKTALSRMQDIAGGRIVVPDLVSQDAAAARVADAFTNFRLVDRRENPVIGYHALHVVIRKDGKSYELQIRTDAQQRWAQLSEKIADLVGFEIKYGGGDENLRELLENSGKIVYLSEFIMHQVEIIAHAENEIATHQPGYEKKWPIERVTQTIESNKADLEEELRRLQRIIEHFEGTGRR